MVRLFFSFLMFNGYFLLLRPVQANRITHPTAIFSGLDKITGRITKFDVAINETVQFGTLQITPHVCYTRPPTEPPRTTSFVRIDEILPTKERKNLFSGWMFADSPGLHGVEHPVYDIWLSDCKNGTKLIQDPHENPYDLPEDSDIPERGRR